MSKDLHKEPFDEGTKIKLSLYEDYLKEWLPVFLAKEKPLFKKINIFDFFAGPGLDKNNCKGSPLITIDALYPYFPYIINNSLEVNLYFNEKARNKLNLLKENIYNLKVDKKPFKVHYSDKDFQVIFKEYFPIASQSSSANFLFLDQNGIKQIQPEIFKSIINLPRTDFLFFISSSTIYRFADHPDIKKYIDLHDGSYDNYLHIHRAVLNFYQELIPCGKEYYLAPFSIKKGSNIYGLIFGSGSIRGIEKFLTRCWKVDPVRGEANFDIDEDMINPHQKSLFEEFDKPKKLKIFEVNLAKEILEKKIVTNTSIYYYALSNGFLARHAKEIVKKMIDEKILPKQKINISYDSCIKKKANPLEYW